MYCVSSMSLCLREGGVKILEDGRTVIKTHPPLKNGYHMKSPLSAEKVRRE